VKGKTNREHGWDLRTRVAVRRELDGMAKRLRALADRRRPLLADHATGLDAAADVLQQRGEELTR
jgi:hypothetical protein